MTDTRDDSALFDADVLAETARAHDVEKAELAAALARHQADVESLPGVENLVYEWRKRYESPLLARTADAYYLAVPERVWTEFGDALDADDETLDAMIEVHQRTVAARADVEPDPPDERAYVALDRTVGDGESGPT